MGSKKKAVKQHFFKRSLERVGVLLNEKELIRKIQNQELEFIERQSNRKTVFRFEHLGNSFRVVYDKIRKQIITILFEIGEQGNAGG
ncbi:MAG: hypothetical protein LUH05_06310 [Candidatus Gastranaerophilales bacterium]|nr:hypothetical protein [Candidatus Gastranaerophilales bacterium]